MNKARLEAFSDGVLAIIITIMVLEIKVPHETGWHAMKPLLPVFYSYILSFLFVAIYWGNHHHLLHTVKNVSPSMIWANMNLLFWLSLIPFATGWMGENNFDATTVVVYAIVLLLCGAAFTILQLTIQRSDPQNMQLRAAFDKLKTKAFISMTCYAASIPIAFVNTTISGILFLVVALVWVIPDIGLERASKE